MGLTVEVTIQLMPSYPATLQVPHLRVVVPEVVPGVVLQAILVPQVLLISQALLQAVPRTFLSMNVVRMKQSGCVWPQT